MGKHLVDLTHDTKLTVAYATSMVIAAYEHELFESSWLPGQETAWSGTLNALLRARSQLLSTLILARLCDYRNQDLNRENFTH